MAEKQTASPTRTVETEIQIAAPVEAVWKALTEAEELERWFPLQARVEPGENGSIFHGWGDWASWDNRIEVWEPGKHLRTSYVGGGEAYQGRQGLKLAVDYYLEARGGGTYLRLVHSGFGPDASWDAEYNGVRRGWQYELRSLRHYLERHRGTIRRVAWSLVTLEVPWEEAWKRLMSRDGLLREGEIEGLKEGDRYSIKTATGQALSGVVHIVNIGTDFAGSVENLNDGLFRVGIEAAQKGVSAVLWLATYDLPQPRVLELKDGFESILKALF